MIPVATSSWKIKNHFHQLNFIEVNKTPYDWVPRVTRPFYGSNENMAHSIDICWLPFQFLPLDLHAQRAARNIIDLSNCRIVTDRNFMNTDICSVKKKKHGDQKHKFVMINVNIKMLSDPIFLFVIFFLFLFQTFLFVPNRIPTNYRHSRR